MSSTSGDAKRPFASASNHLVADASSGHLPDETTYQVLLVDSEESVRRASQELSAVLGMSIQAVGTFAAAEQVLVKQHIDLLLLDLDLSEPQGVQQLEGIRASHPDTSVVIATAASTVNAAIQAIRLGASDFLTTPLAIEELTDVLQRAAKRKSHTRRSQEVQRQLMKDAEAGPLIGHAPAMEKIIRIISKVTFTTHPVLILGASGTGKELVAKTIHEHGPNAHHPFVPVYCNGAAAEIMERDLFGYARGSFPEATSGRAGLLVEADHGTIFFDCIDELTLELQGKLVRVLQEREVRRVGSNERVPVHARILASTDADLADMQASGKFRRDLFFRLNVVNIHMPTLAERREDIPLLTDHILQRIRKETGVPFELGTELRETLSSYTWPGNIRELESALERASVMASSPMITLEDFPTQIVQNRSGVPALDNADISGGADLPKVASIAELEKQAIIGALRQLGGDKLKAARLLGIGKTTLYRKLKEYELDEPATSQIPSAAHSGDPSL